MIILFNNRIILFQGNNYIIQNNYTIKYVFM